MNTAWLFTGAVVAFGPFASAVEELKRPAPLVIELPKELVDQGWTIVPQREGVPIGKGIRFVHLENRKLKRTVLRDDKTMKQTHASVVLCVLDKSAMPDVLEKWDADYEREKAEYRALVENTPGTALAPPQHQAASLFWQTNDYIILVSSETDGSEEAALKVTLKRQLIGK